MDKIIKNALWCTFLLFLAVSYINTARLASEFETNVIMAYAWAGAVELGEVALLLGTLKRKREGKPYGGYMATFMVSLAVSVAANGLEGSNTFLGNNTVFTSLHEFQYPWILPTLLGMTIPALMLATSSLLADFSLDSSKAVTVSSIDQPTSQDVRAIEKEEITPNFKQQINVQILNTPSCSKKEEKEMSLTKMLPDNQSELMIKNKMGDYPSDICEISIKEAAIKYNVSERTIKSWRAKQSSVTTTG